jgi:glycerol-3-phosphate cytidylyltransferase-like family protein
MTYEYKGPVNQYKGHPKTIVIISGYWNPIHDGHREYMTITKGLGDVLWVVVNNDAQQMLKKHKIIRNEQSRIEAVHDEGYADEIILSIDEDPSQCRTLEMIVRMNPGNHFIFANGGDRNAGNIPEATICKKYGIKMVDGCGAKIDSSTRINREMGLEEDPGKR